MRILFIDTPGGTPPSPLVRGDNLSHAIAKLGAILLHHGHEVSVLDMNNHIETHPFESIHHSIKVFKPHMVCLSILSIQYRNALEVIRQIRMISDCKIVVGGAGISSTDQQIFADSDFCVDVAAIGEGETIIAELAECYEQQNDAAISEIKGVLWNQNGTIIETGTPEIVSDWDTYPTENLDLFGIETIGVYEIMASRGCKYSCSFCYNHAGHTMRNRQPLHIVHELEETYKKYHFKKFRFIDAFLNNDEAWIIELCELLNRSSVNKIPWEAYGIRSDHLTEKMCKTMTQSGCELVGIGVESLHPEVFQKIRKGTSLERMKEGVVLAGQYFPKVVCYMIIGLEEDTLERTLYSYHQLKKLKPYRAQFTMAVPLPGTRLENYVNHHARMLGSALDSRLFNYDLDDTIAFDTPEYPIEDRKLAFALIKTKEFNYVTWNSIRYPRKLYSWLKIAFQYDTLRIPRHLFEILKQEVKLYHLRKSPKRVQVYTTYQRIPDGTWSLKMDSFKQYQ